MGEGGGGRGGEGGKQDVCLCVHVCQPVCLCIKPTSIAYVLGGRGGAGSTEI